MREDPEQQHLRPRASNVTDDVVDRQQLMPIEEAVQDAGHEGQEADEEAEEAVRRPEVKAPTKEEVRRHNVSHLPFRSWCPQCVACRGKDDAHRAREDPEAARGAEVHFDYAFLRNEEGGNKATVLVGRCRQSKFLVAHVVPAKGESEEWVVDEVVQDLKSMGLNGQVLLRGDQERSLSSFFERVAEKRGELKTIPEEAPKGDSKGNGFAERAVQQFEEIMRVHKLALDNLVGRRIPIEHPCIPWLVQHAADVVNRYLVMSDGTTAYERVKRRKSSAVMHEFALPVMHRVSGAVQGGVMSERWYEGLWLGKHFMSGEDLVSLEDGRVIRARSIEERPTSVKLTMKMLDKVTGLTWKPTSTLSGLQPVDMRTPDGQQGEHPEVIEAPEVPPLG